MPPSNILMITCHDLGDYLGCYGTPVPTPNLDTVADDGVVFENHFSTGTVCSPSRGSIMTGCYPHTHGLMGLIHRGWELDVKACPPLPALLREHGYRTHLFGFQHEHPDPSCLGYEQVHQTQSVFCDEVTPALTAWLRKEGKGKQPFLASVGFEETHRQDIPSHFRRESYEPADKSEVEVRAYLPDIPEVRDDLAGFYGAIKLVDRMVGDILGVLEDLGLSGETLVIFTTDHGASFMHSKGTLYDGGTKVACLMRLPGELPAGRRVRALTSHADMVPTILEAAGIDVPGHIQGKSFLATARGRDQSHREYVYAEKNYTNYYDPSRMVRSKRFKHIRKGLRTCIFDFIIPELELCPSGFRQNRAVFDFYPARRCTEELYDLLSDPAELNNLAGDKTRDGILNKMRAALDAHLEATDDPFRHLRNDILMTEGTYEALRARTKAT